MSAKILSDALFESFDSSIKETDDAESLPPVCYTDEDFFGFEKTAIFHKEWLCVGRASSLRHPGDYFTVTHAGEPILIAMTKSGELKAMSSVCQHRAMLVAEGHGNTRAFVCPYHHWTYGLDGKLIGAPAMERACNFDRKSVALPELKLEVWNGFIFVNMDMEATPLADRLGLITDALANYELDIAEGPRIEEAASFPWNWKVMMENNNDGYHATRLHRGPLHDFIPSELSVFPKVPADTAGYLRFNGTTHQDVGFNALQKAVLPIFPKLTIEERNRVVFVNLPPTLSLVVLSDFVLYLILYADSAGSHRMAMGYLVKPSAMDEPLFKERMDMNMSAAGEITSQDLHVDELVQLGLKSKFAPRGRYSWQEQAQRDLNVWLVSRYRQTWEQMSGKTPPTADQLPASKTLAPEPVPAL